MQGSASHAGDIKGHRRKIEHSAIRWYTYQDRSFLELSVTVAVGPILPTSDACMLKCNIVVEVNV